METVKAYWKTWFSEKADKAEIREKMRVNGEEDTQKKLNFFLSEITRLKKGIEETTQKRKAYEEQIENFPTNPELDSKIMAVVNLKDKIKEDKKQLEVSLASMATEISQMFDLPDFSNMELCSNSSITIGIKNEVDWEFDGTNHIPEECFTIKAMEIKKAINPWVKKQLSMGKIELPGIRIKQRMKIKAAFKKNRTR